MLLKVDFKSGEPVYLQLISQVKLAIASGALRFGSIRGEWPAILATVAIAGLLIPLRSSLQHALDKIFFPKRQRARPLLNRLKTEFWSNPSLNALLERIAEACEEFLTVRPS